eukprot:6569826-Pyramimonas_sp.AAC.1
MDGEMHRHAGPNGRRRACRIISIARMSVSECRRARMQLASFGCEMHWRCVPASRSGGMWCNPAWKDSVGTFVLKSRLSLS